MACRTYVGSYKKNSSDAAEKLRNEKAREKCSNRNAVTHKFY